MVITLQLPSNFSLFFKHFGPSSKHKWNLEPGLGSYLVPLWIPVPKLVLKIKTNSIYFLLLNGTNTKMHILTSQPKYPPFTLVQTNVVRINVIIKFSGLSSCELDFNSHLFVQPTQKLDCRISLLLDPDSKPKL
jgi:hypothetical protein